MCLADDLIDGRTSCLRPAVGGHGGKGSGSTIKMRVDASHITTHLIHIAHDEQLVFQRLERLEHVLKSLRLQRRWNAESEKNIKRADGHLGLDRAEGVGGNHLLKEREADGNTAEPLEHGTAVDVDSLHSWISVWVFNTKSLITMAVIRLP